MHGNISTTYGWPATVNVDITAPTVDSFSAPSSGTNLTLSGITLTASDNVGVTESSTPPSAGAAGWTASAPTTLTVGGDSTYTLYPWVKDAAGHVSAVYGSPASVIVETTAPSVVSSARVTANPTNAATRASWSPSLCLCSA